MILDNVDDSTFLKLPGPDIEAAATRIKSGNARQLISYIPYCQHGSVLVTSRNRSAALQLVEPASTINIEPMSGKDALQLFQNKLGQSDNEANTVELAAALEHMPLAIVQAAAYILQRRPRYSLEKYLDEFRNTDKRKATLLKSEGGALRRDAEAKNSILITWHISFTYIRATRPSAADLLSLMSFCDGQGIPEVLIRSQGDHTCGNSKQNHRVERNIMSVIDEQNNEEDNQSVDSDSDRTEQQSNYTDGDSFEEDIITLRNFCFIIVNEDGATFQMHRLVQLATLEWLRAHNEYEGRQHQFLTRLCVEIPVGEYENWTKCEALFPHAHSVSAQRPVGKEPMKEWATILYRAAWYAIRKGKGIEAEKLSVRAMKARAKLYDMEHDDVIWSKALVASAYSMNGRWSEAERLEVQVMETSKTKLGEDHPDTQTSMANLASTFWNQGRWEEAERLQVQVMETRKTKLGEDHPDTLTSMNNLAWTYWELARLDDAKTLMGHCIQLREVKLGASHPDYLFAVDTLARWER
ncbi:hypothetical protein NQ176_g7535 [Zarea fungicola]|uniref:Uncharacterized protein n=1 Tax=Zarea fungicola TaxID=93591 RepID=A0ACC1MZW9_9HYPO|nr:hypothetical protein NQ176_g7535 [Lecanicillium fungicola]